MKIERLSFQFKVQFGKFFFQVLKYSTSFRKIRFDKLLKNTFERLSIDIEENRTGRKRDPRNTIKLAIMFFNRDRDLYRIVSTPLINFN